MKAVGALIHAKTKTRGFHVELEAVDQGNSQMSISLDALLDAYIDGEAEDGLD